MNDFIFMLLSEHYKHENMKYILFTEYEWKKFYSIFLDIRYFIIFNCLFNTISSE